MNSLVRARSINARVLGAGILVLAGCSDRELEPDQPYGYASSSSSSGYGVGGSGGSGGGEGDGGSGGGNGGGGGGGEPLEACPEPETFEASLTRDDGYDACGPGTRTVDLRGEVLEAALAEDGTLVWKIRACVAGDSACESLVYELSARAPDLDVVAPPGTFVEVRFKSVQDLEKPVGDPCRDLVVVRNLPELGGVPNPSGTDSAIWFGGSSFVREHPQFSAAPNVGDERLLKVSPLQGPRCDLGEGGATGQEGEAEIEVHAGHFLFAAEDLESARVEVPMGTGATWDVPAPSAIAGAYEVRALNVLDLYEVNRWSDGTISSRSFIGATRDWVIERKVP